MYRLNITENDIYPFLECIVKGAKKAEGRIATDYIKSFKVGEKLLLSSTKEYLICEILYLNFYESFEDMLESEGFKNMVPFAKNREEALKIYKSFPGAERVRSMGCCAIGVKSLENKLTKI